MIKRHGIGSRPARRTRSGAAMVEMAIVLPLLCVATLGLMEYGWVFYKIAQVNQAARHAVRTAVRPNATVADVTSAVGFMMDQANIPPASYSWTYSPITVAVGQPVAITITVPFNKIQLTGTSLVPLPTNLTGKGVMAKESP